MVHAELLYWQSMAEATAETKPVGRPRRYPSQLQSVSELKVTVGNLADASKALREESRATSLCTINVPNLLLLHWAKQKHTVVSDVPFSYISIINYHITDGIICIDPKCERLEKRLCKKAGELASKVKSSSGSRKREAVLAGSGSFIINAGETISAKELQSEIDFLSQEVVEWQEKLSEAHEDVSKLKQELTCSCRNKSKKVSEVGKRQKCRKLHQFQSFVEEALWFAESFGLIPQYLSVSTDMNESMIVPLSEQTKYSVDEDTVRQTLYLLERFGVSDQFYHELSMAYPSLARSYKVKQLRRDVGSEVDVVSLDQPYDGAYRPFKSLLVGTIKHEVSCVLLFVQFLLINYSLKLDQSSHPT